MIVQSSRIQNKFSTVSGVVPTIPATDDHTDGTWLPTDIYVGEIFINVADDLAWVRTYNGIILLAGSGAYIGDFVSASAGGTFSGDVYGTLFEAPIINGGDINVTNDINIGGTATAAYFVGDGSGLTGISATWNGGTVLNVSDFLASTTFQSGIGVDTISPATVGPISFTDNVDLGANDLDTTGIITANQFVGDGSLLTGITGMGNDYTIGATLSGNVIHFDRTDLTDAYQVDLTPVVGPQLSTVTWDWPTNTWEATLTDASTLPIVIDEFNDITVHGNVTADYFVGDGSLLTGVVSVPGGLSDVLGYGNTAGAYNIEFDQINYGLINTFNTGFFNNTSRVYFDADGVQMHATNDATTAEATIKANANGSIYISADGPSSFNFGDSITINGVMGWQGLEYNADYSANFTARSLVDKEYVDGLVGSTPTLSQVLVSGNINGDSQIILNSSTWSNNSINDGGTTDYRTILFKDHATDLNFDFISIESTNGINSSAIDLYKNGTLNIDGVEVNLPNVKFTAGSTGHAQYFADYSAAFTARSLVDKGYVDSIGSLTLSQVLTNGNISGGNNIQLTANGFTLTADAIEATGNTYDEAIFTFENIDTDVWAPIMKVLNGDQTNNVLVDGDHTNIFSSKVGGLINRNTQVNVDNYSIIMTADDLAAGKGNQLEINPDYMVITGTSLTFQGLEYASDYSANYTNRSLVDKEYVDTLVTGGSVISSDIGTTETPSPFAGQYLLAYKPSTDEVTKFDIDDFLPTRNTSTGLTAGTHTLLTQLVYDSSMDFFEWKYIATAGSGIKRAGTIMAFRDGSTVNFSDDGPMPIGDTSGLTFDVALSGVNIELRAVITSGTWHIISHATPWRSGVLE